MDKFIDTRFERVERALTTLIDSIAKYNPSTVYANDLAAADKELSKGLEELQTHQNNYLRIQSLRAGIVSLDTQIKSTLTSLASTRKDITTTSTTVFPDGPTYDIHYDELLSYARRISKTTLPPAGVTNGIDLDAPATPADAAQTPAPPTPAGATPLPSGMNGAPTPTPGQPSQISEAEQPSQMTNASTLPEHLGAYLNPQTGQLFIPWPDDRQLRTGSVSGNQEHVDRGVDLVGFDPEEEERLREAAQAEEQRRREAQQAEEQRMAEERARRQMEAARARGAERQEEWRRGSVAGVPRSSTTGPGENRDQFQFVGLEDDDDDE